jgi:hypothetical protein
MPERQIEGAAIARRNGQSRTIGEATAARVLLKRDAGLSEQVTGRHQMREHFLLLSDRALIGRRGRDDETGDER